MKNLFAQAVGRFRKKSQAGGDQNDHPEVAVELGRGYIDYLSYQNGRLIIIGWMLLPEQPFDGFGLRINNVSFGSARQVVREDVQNAFPSLSTALRSGFHVDTAVPEEILKDWSDIDIMGLHNGREVARISTIYKLDFLGQLKEPPAALMRRVANVDNPNTYWCRALTSFNEFSKAIKRYRDPASIQCLLDWGCGCGRVVSLFLQHSNIPQIYGCDIDKEAVQWCGENLPKGRFSAIEPYPPTSFTNNMFDVVISYSVFTHLVRDVQESWLKEMKRIMMPGGLFFASCHGDFATSFSPAHVQKEVAGIGISDSSLDPNLDGIAPTGYYRGVFQSKAYTMKEWGKHFRILDYIDRGMGNFQDLVIMQKEK